MCRSENLSSKTCKKGAHVLSGLRAFSVSPISVFVGIGELGNFYQEFGSGFFKEREIREV